MYVCPIILMRSASPCRLRLQLSWQNNEPCRCDWGRTSSPVQNLKQFRWDFSASLFPGRGQGLDRQTSLTSEEREHTRFPFSPERKSRPFEMEMNRGVLSLRQPRPTLHGSSCRKWRELFFQGEWMKTGIEDNRPFRLPTPRPRCEKSLAQFNSVYSWVFCCCCFSFFTAVCALQCRAVRQL